MKGSPEDMHNEDNTLGSCFIFGAAHTLETITERF